MDVVVTRTRTVAVRRSWVVAAALFLGAGCRQDTRESAQSEDSHRVIAITGGTVRTAPDAAPITGGVVLITGERITAVGPSGTVDIPADATIIDASGGTVLAAFWNSHVHLTDPRWQNLDVSNSTAVAGLLQEMFTRFGFAHVVDIASFPEITLALRERVRAGDIAGPDIRTTLVPFVPPGGTPRYVAPVVLPEFGTPGAAHDSVQARVTQGADGIKLFTMPVTRTRPFPVMPAAVVRSVVDAAHAAGRFVVAHPTDLPGVRVAVENGVDVLAHTAPEAGPLPAALVRQMLDRHTALIPTMTLWELESGGDTVVARTFVRAAQEQVRAYAGLGGRILFGTDAGYHTRYDPAREYELMAGADLDARAILASLTTTPATQFGAADRTGRLADGYDADIVIVDGDPWQDIRALSKVRLTMKRGRTLYQASPGQR